MVKDYRLPRGTKLQRRMRLIGQLWDQIPFYYDDGGSPTQARRRINEDFPDWKSGHGYGGLVWAARCALASPFKRYVEGSFDDGAWGGDVVRDEPKNPDVYIDYERMIRQIAESTRSREAASAPSEDEIGSRLEAARTRGSEELQRVAEELMSRLPRPAGEIEYSVRVKVYGFLRSRSEKIQEG